MFWNLAKFALVLPLFLILILLTLPGLILLGLVMAVGTLVDWLGYGGALESIANVIQHD